MDSRERPVVRDENSGVNIRKPLIDYRALSDKSYDLVYLLDHRGFIIFIHEVFDRNPTILLDAFIGSHFLDMVSPKDRPRVEGYIQSALKGDNIPPYKVEYTDPDGRLAVLEFEMRPIYDGDRIIGIQGVVRNLTESRREFEGLLVKCEAQSRAKQDFEKKLERIQESRDVFPTPTLSSALRVQERRPVDPNSTTQDTIDWRETEVEFKEENENREWPVKEQPSQFKKIEALLLNEIEKRKKIEKELKIKADNFEEIDAALNVLLRKRESDKRELEEKVRANMTQLIEPHLEKLRKSKLDERQEIIVSILRANLSRVASEFSAKLSSGFFNLTPAELQIADLIRQGRSTKEIADLMNLSWTTIKGYRTNIRAKLGIKNKKANLRSYLLSLS